MKKIFLCSALAMVFLNAHAESNHCKLSDFNGDWVGFQAEILTIPGTPPSIPPTYPHTGACTFTVSDGTIDDGTCELTVPNPAAAPPTFIYPTPHFDGTVEINSDCSATFTFNFPVRGTRSDYQVQLAPDKKTYAGRWEAVNGAGEPTGPLGPTNGVKKPKSNPHFHN